jgi:hypothetical protein
MDKEQLHREEVRGLFALGVIATILAYRHEFVAIISPGSPLGGLIVWVVAINWGLYAFLMTVGLSDDVFKPSISRNCFTLAKFAFWGGVADVAAATIIVIVGLLIGGIGSNIVLCDPLGILCFHSLIGIMVFPIALVVWIIFMKASLIWGPVWKWATKDLKRKGTKPLKS